MRLPTTELYLEDEYPNLAADGYKIKGCATWLYNCVGLAEADYWKWNPPNNSTETLLRYLQDKGWQHCDKTESAEDCFMLVIYVDAYGDWTHVAVRQRNGKWLSKLGDSILIEHNTVVALEGFIESAYGIAKFYMQRERRLGDP